MISPVGNGNDKKLTGPEIHPGANQIRMSDPNDPDAPQGVSVGATHQGMIRSLAFGDRDRAAENLR